MGENVNGPDLMVVGGLDAGENITSVYGYFDCFHLTLNHSGPCSICAEIKEHEETAEQKQFERDCKAVCGFCLEGLRVDYSISKEYWHHGPYDNSPDIGIRLCAADRLRRAWEERTP